MACIALLACSTEKEIISEPETPEGVLVSFAFAGDVLVENTPLSRAEGSDNDLYGIQIYEYPTTGTSATAYAFGLFNDIDNLTAVLNPNRKYKFECTLVKDGRTKVYYARNYYGYGAPFRYYNDDWESDYAGMSNSFRIEKGYGNRTLYFVDLSTETNPAATNADNTKTNPPIDRYYGVLDNFVPTEGGVVSIELKNTSFGLQAVIEDIPDGSVSVAIKKGDSRIFFAVDGITESYQSDRLIFECSDVLDAWTLGDDYVEPVIISGTWMRGSGVEQTLVNKTIYLKRNAMNIVRLTFKADNGDANIGITTEDDVWVAEESVDVKQFE